MRFYRRVTLWVLLKQHIKCLPQVIYFWDRVIYHHTVYGVIVSWDSGNMLKDGGGESGIFSESFGA